MYLNLRIPSTRLSVPPRYTCYTFYDTCNRLTSLFPSSSSTPEIFQTQTVVVNHTYTNLPSLSIVTSAGRSGRSFSSLLRPRWAHHFFPFSLFNNGVYLFCRPMSYLPERSRPFLGLISARCLSGVTHPSLSLFSSWTVWSRPCSDGVTNNCGGPTWTVRRGHSAEAVFRKYLRRRGREKGEVEPACDL